MNFLTTEENVARLASLAGTPLSSTIVTNSLKLRFNTNIDLRGKPYLWIDPPWELYEADSLIAESDEYDKDGDQEGFFSKCAPLYSTVLESSTYDNGVLTLNFKGSPRLTLPPCIDLIDSEDWYHHWYVSDGTLPAQVTRSDGLSDE
jgi:hypothetical protein